jgi:anti-anti-sigma factor
MTDLQNDGALVPGLEVEVLSDSDGSLLRVSGELDAATARELVAEVEPLILSGRRHIVLDCHGLTFTDSCGLRAMIVLWRQVDRDGGSLMIARPSPMLRRLLEATGLHERFEIVG